MHRVRILTNSLPHETRLALPKPKPKQSSDSSNTINTTPSEGENIPSIKDIMSNFKPETSITKAREIAIKLLSEIDQKDRLNDRIKRARKMQESLNDRIHLEKILEKELSQINTHLVSTTNDLGRILQNPAKFLRISKCQQLAQQLYALRMDDVAKFEAENQGLPDIL